MEQLRSKFSFGRQASILSVSIMIPEYSRHVVSPTVLCVVNGFQVY